MTDIETTILTVLAPVFLLAISTGVGIRAFKRFTT